MTKKTNATTARVSATATATNNNNNATAQQVATGNTATTATTDNTKTAHAPMDEKTIIYTARVLLDDYGTMTDIRAHYAELCDQYGKANAQKIRDTAKSMRADDLTATATALVGRLSFDSVLSSVWRGVIAESTEFSVLAFNAKRQYRASDSATARQLIADYYTNVDEDGAPLSVVAYINDNATTIATAYKVRDLTATNAVGILRTALVAFGKDARNTDTKTNHKRANNVRAVGVVVRAFNVVRGADGRAVRGVEDETATVQMRGLSVENWQTLNDYNNSAE
jgi:hypothetical protein